MVDDNENEEYNDFKRDLEEIEKAVQAQSEQFDKYVLTLASGLFGVSIAFVKNIAGDEPTYVGCMVMSWVFLGISICITLGSFLASYYALRHNRNVLIKSYKKEEISEDEWAPPPWTEYMNIFSYIFFILGILMFCIFTMVNMGNENGKEKESEKKLTRVGQGWVSTGEGGQKRHNKKIRKSAIQTG